jgi:orotate phosphoribosyltransferase
MLDYQRELIEFSLQRGALGFGEFRLKSGRVSPYFFNTGLFNDGESLVRLGRAYAHAVQHAGLQYDMLFGPAYKGITLVAALSVALVQSEQRSVPYCFDRKEEKDHGEGGITVGAPLAGRVLIVDDVISAGLSVRHSMDIIRRHNAAPAGVVIVLDRQERGRNRLSAVQEVEQQWQIRVISVITMDNIIEYLEERGGMNKQLHEIHAYRSQYGVPGRP